MPIGVVLLDGRLAVAAKDARDPAPAAIAIVDDVLTAATHYRAMHTALSERLPSVPVVGFFIARRVFPNDLAGDFPISDDQ